MRKTFPSLALAAALAAPGCFSADEPSMQTLSGGRHPSSAPAVATTADREPEAVVDAKDQVAVAPVATPAPSPANEEPSTRQAEGLTGNRGGVLGSVTRSDRSAATDALKAVASAAPTKSGSIGYGGLGGDGIGAGGSGQMARLMSASDESAPMAKEERRQEAPAKRRVPAQPFGVATTSTPVAAPPQSGGTFEHAGVNPWTLVKDDAQSTFAIDVDTASYTYARRFLAAGQKPNAGAVRVEEWVNAFHYSYAPPKGEHPFAVHMAAAPSPVHKGKELLRIGVKGKEVSNKERKPVHLTFLVDVSGSMSAQDKLPLAQKAMHLLTDQLRDDDSVGLVTYAGSNRQVLAQTSAKNKKKIHDAIDALMSGGGTNMGSGMEMAYQNANKFLSSDSVSRVIVLSDGDANIGNTNHQSILKSIKGYASEGVTMTTVGFGTGNYNDHLMEQLADAGNGNYVYVDSMKAARKAFVEDLTGTLQVIAKDVKIQVEFNPDVVKAYRLIGYENRDIADKDFRNDKVDAGEIGAGHSVTALYEVELHDKKAQIEDDIATVRVRYKAPRGEKATEVASAFTASKVKDRFSDLDNDARWAMAVSLAAEVLRGSPEVEGFTLEDAYSLAAESAEGRYKEERMELVNLLGKVVKRDAVAGIN